MKKKIVWLVTLLAIVVLTVPSCTEEEDDLTSVKKEKIDEKKVNGDFTVTYNALKKDYALINDSIMPIGDSITFYVKGDGTYDWEFGDGKKVRGGKLVSHVYQTAGTYTVTLYLVDGTESEKVNQIKVITAANAMLSTQSPVFYKDAANKTYLVFNPNTVSGQASITGDFYLEGIVDGTSYWTNSETTPSTLKGIMLGKNFVIFPINLVPGKNISYSVNMYKFNGSKKTWAWFAGSPWYNSSDFNLHFTVSDQGIIAAN